MAVASRSWKKTGTGAASVFPKLAWVSRRWESVVLVATRGNEEPFSISTRSDLVVQNYVCVYVTCCILETVPAETTKFGQLVSGLTTLSLICKSPV